MAIIGTEKRREKVMMFFNSTVSPDHDSARITSSRVIIPRSPCDASLGWTKEAGVPVEAIVAAIFCPMCPLLPIPDTITRPRAFLISATASENGPARPLSREPRSAPSPSVSSSSVRNAEAITDRVSERPPGIALNLLLVPATAHPKIQPTFRSPGCLPDSPWWNSKP